MIFTSPKYLISSSKYLIYFFIYQLTTGCIFDKSESQKKLDVINFVSDTSDTEKIIIESSPSKSKIAIKLDSLGLVDIHTIDTNIIVDLKYSTTDNFTGQILYDSLYEAYFQIDVAIMLSNAQKYLQDTLPEAKLLIYDAARPLSVQKIMWEKVKNTRFIRYVAAPYRTSLHNYGVAVDLTVIDKNGIPLDMGTPYDYFGKKAGTNEKELVADGLLTSQQAQNRQLLRFIMKKAGFSPVSGEWWHFNACTLAEAKNRYILID